jgi:glyoxylase-like metal-dependent hydrolase (beta-lactamase superfamily II)
MNKVKILVQGYAHSKKDGSYIASPTTTLVESNGVRFIVDPGASGEKLLKAMKNNNIRERDLSFIYLTHWHPDHFLNIQLFPTLPVYDGEILWKGDWEVNHFGKLPEVDVQILKTPGHSSEHSSLLINTLEGNICIAGDVFWWEDGKQKSNSKKDLVNLKDPFATDKKELLKSRKLVLSKSDFIIPGHGRLFKTPK